MLMPYAAGVLGGAYGLRVAFVMVPVGLALLATLLAVLARRLVRVAELSPTSFNAQGSRTT